MNRGGSRDELKANERGGFFSSPESYGLILIRWGVISWTPACLSINLNYGAIKSS